MVTEDTGHEAIFVNMVIHRQVYSILRNRCANVISYKMRIQFIDQNLLHQPQHRANY